MLYNFIPLLASWLPIFTNFIIYILAGYLIIGIACFIHSLLRG